MTSELFIKEEAVGESVILSVKGEIDIYTAQKLKEKLYSVIEANNKDLKVDCSELNYIDSTGLGIFVGVLKKMKMTGRNIYLLNLKENISKLFIITGLDKLFIMK